MPSETDETKNNTMKELITLVLQQANEISYDLHYFKLKSRGIHMKIQNDIDSFNLYADKSVLRGQDEMRLKKEKMLNSLNDWYLELNKVAAVISELRKLSNPEDPTPNITVPSPKQTCSKLRALNNVLYYKNLHMKWFSAWLKTQLAHKRLQQEATINLLNMCLQNEDLSQTSSTTYNHGSSSKLTPSLSDMISEISKMISDLSLKSADDIPTSKPSVDEKQPTPSDIHETKPQITSSPSNPKVYIFGVRPKTSEPTQASQESSKFQQRTFRSARRKGTSKPQNLPMNPTTNVFEANTNTRSASSKPSQTSQDSSLKSEPQIFKANQEERKPQIDKQPKNVKPKQPTANNVHSDKSSQASQGPLKFHLPTFETFKSKHSTNNNETTKPMSDGSSNGKIYVFGAKTTTSEPQTQASESSLKFQLPIYDFFFANHENTSKLQTNCLPKNPMTNFDAKPMTSNSDSYKYHQASPESLKVEPPISKSANVNDTKQINNPPSKQPTKPIETKSTPTTEKNVDFNPTRASKESATNNLPRRPRLVRTFKYKSANVNNESGESQNNGPSCSPKDHVGEKPLSSDGTPPVRFIPKIGTDIIDNTKVRYQCITCIKKFKDKSLEELRLEDYVGGRKGPSLFESQLKNNASSPRRIIRIASTHKRETPTEKFTTSAQHQDTPTEHFDITKHNQEIPTQSFDSSTRNRETPTQLFESQDNVEKPTQHFDTSTQNKVTPTQQFDTSIKNRVSPTQNRETPTQLFESQTDIEKPTQHFDSSIQNREKSTQHIDPSTQNRETPTHNFDTIIQDRESPTQFFDSQTQNGELPTQFCDTPTQNRETPTQFFDCQTQNRESPTQFFDSQTQNQETSTKHWETTPDDEPSDSDENTAAVERLLEAGNFEEALKMSNDALKLDPENAYFSMFRGRAYYALKKYAEALEDLKKAIVTIPILPANVCVYIAKCYLRLGKITSGEHAIWHAIERNRGLQKTLEVEELRESFVSVRRLQESAHEMMSQQKYFDAVYYIDECLKNYCPACSMMKLLKAECLAHMRKFNEARSIAIDTSLLSNSCTGSMYADAMYVVGLCSYYQEYDEMAIKKFRKVLEHDPDHEKAIKMIKLTKARKNTKLIQEKKEEGNKAFKAGAWTKALKLYNEALSIDKNNKQENAKLHYNRATVFAKQNQLSNAIDACTAALELDQNYIKPLLRRAQCYTEIRMYEKALEDYEKLYYIDSTDEYKHLLQEANDLLMANKGPYYYYKILGINKFATLDEIKKAYKKCAMRYHPDRHACASLGEVRTNERKFKQMKEAYDTLSEPRTRANYDRTQCRYDTESEDEWG